MRVRSVQNFLRIAIVAVLALPNWANAALPKRRANDRQRGLERQRETVSKSPASAPQGSLIAGGDFESGPVDPETHLTPNWITYDPFAAANIRVVEREGRNGSRCGFVETTSDTIAVLVSEPQSPVSPGEVLHVSIWCRAEGLSSHSGGVANCTLGYMDIHGSYFDWIRIPAISPADSGATSETTNLRDWVHVERTVTVPPKTSFVSLQLGLRYATGKVWFDDATLTGDALAARFGLSGEELEASATTVPLVVINRLPQAQGSQAEVRVNPGGQTLRHTLTGDTMTTLPAPIRVPKRGKFAIEGRLDATINGARLVKQTSGSVTVLPAIVAEPPSPTHWVIEDPSPAIIDLQLDVHLGPDTPGATGIMCALQDKSGKEVSALGARFDEGPPQNPLKFQMILPEKVSKAPGDYKIVYQLLADREAGPGGREPAGDRPPRVVATSTDDWHVIHRAQSHVTMSADGYPVVNGERIFPLGMYMGEKSTHDFSDYPKLASLGLNVMQSFPSFAGPGSSNRTAKAFLDATEHAGMHSLTYLTHGPFRLPNDEALRRLRMFRNHPAILMWDQEEAVARGYKPLSYLEFLYNAIKREAPDHPMLEGDQCDTSPKLIGRSDTWPDAYMDAGIWWWHPTPLRMKTSIENYEGAPGGPAKEYKAPPWLTDSGTTKPIWVALQCYKKPIIEDARFPTPEEYRCHAYLAVCHGARGLMYYTGNGEHGGGVLNRPGEAHWDYLQKLIRELHEMSPVFLAPDAPQQAEVLTSGALVSVRLKQVGNRRVLIAVNRAEPVGDVQFRIPAAAVGGATAGAGARQIGGKVPVRFEGRNVGLSQDGSMTDRFTAYAVHIYDLP